MRDRDFRKVFDALPLTAAVLDERGCVLSVNQSWRDFAVANGGDPTDGIGADYRGVCRVGEGIQTERAITELLLGERERFEVEYPCHSPEERRWFLLQASRLEVDGKARVLVCHLDITRRRLAEEAATRRADYDDLTGLLNRASFKQRLARCLDRAERQGRRVAVLFADLDGFKAVNDTHGHGVGDAVLRELGRRLAQDLRRIDSAARIGGDELVVFVDDANPTTRRRVRDRLHTLFTKPIRVGRLSISLSAAIGTAVYPDDGTDVSALLQVADRNMYRDKTAMSGDTRDRA